MGDDHKAPNTQNALIQEMLRLARQSSGRGDILFNSLVSPAIQGKAPAFFRNAVRPSIESGFAGARENLVNFLGKSGQGISGLAAGPMANLYSGEAQAIGDAELQAILQALNVGAGQGFFDPSRYLFGAAGANGPLLQQGNAQSGLWGSLLGAGISAIPWPQSGGGIPNGGWGGGFSWGGGGWG